MKMNIQILLHLDWWSIIASIIVLIVAKVTGYFSAWYAVVPILFDIFVYPLLLQVHENAKYKGHVTDASSRYELHWDAKSGSMLEDALRDTLKEKED